MAQPRIFEAFSPNNPAVVMWKLLSNDRESLEAIAERLGGKPKLDEDSFLRVALEFEPPKGST